MTFSYGFHVRQSEPGAACSSLARFFNVLVRTGLCAIELERANIEDIRNKGAHTVLYVRGKGRGRKDDFVVLTDAAVRLIYAYLSMPRSGAEKRRFSPSCRTRLGGSG